MQLQLQQSSFSFLLLLCGPQLIFAKIYGPSKWSECKPDHHGNKQCVGYLGGAQTQGTPTSYGDFYTGPCFCFVSLRIHKLVGCGD